MANLNILFQPYQLTKKLQLSNRIVMAPMTRAKATDDLVPTSEMVEYYARRADAGLIITEGTVISFDASGYKNVPGIYTQKQIDHWHDVTDAVHKKNGVIFLQIWHVGRVSHPDFLQGKLPISSSATSMSGRISRSEGLFYGTARAATLDEIQQLINTYAIAAKNAMQAGFDGVEIHGANGYLVDQFLHYHTNKREDEYGRTPENMARFALEIIQACGEAIGTDRVAIRLSPGGYLNEIVGEPKDAGVFKYLLEQLNNYSIAYVHTGNFNDAHLFTELNNMTMSAFMRSHYKGTLIGSGGYTVEEAVKHIASKSLDLVAMGRPFIANHDLIKRLANNQRLQDYDATMLNNLY